MLVSNTSAASYGNLETFESLRQGRVAFSNNAYSAYLSEHPRRLESVRENATWESVVEVNLEPLFLMYPNCWPMEDFLEFDGVNELEITGDPNDSDLEVYQCKLIQTELEAPFALDGVWKGKFSKSNKVFVEQSVQSDEFSLTLAYQFNETGKLPTSFIRTYKQFKPSLVMETTKFFEHVRLNPTLPQSVCTLTYYGFPEPPRISKEIPRSWIFVFLLGVTVVILLLIAMSSRRGRKSRSL